MWSEVKDKVAPSKKDQVLCAWKPYDIINGTWNFEVLIHWPDNVWTDTLENEVDEDEIPTYWQTISMPPNPVLDIKDDA
jgi:hypothetical protein